ncbi:hypothetical protein [Lentzea sp. NBRC 105346]|uniref:hypothetical protein n=1 Tax=Lentzea sp. NBRC 105346 TaxID=3032205 RepID=UPI00255724D2|nr:hypothetical protein [Lentzea sp. NBRC 105346]
MAKEVLEYSDAMIPAGGIVSLVLSSANRDETVFSDPDSLDITRDAAAHVAFGRGLRQLPVHYV